MNMITNSQKAKLRADEIESKIIDVLCSGQSFLVEAGAGAGKTYSLTRVVDWLENNKKQEFRKKKQKIACITYTNAAVDVIKERLSDDSLIQPCTIHTFAWELMKQFQNTLLSTIVELDLLPLKEGTEKKISISEISHISYELGARYLREGILYLYHDDVIKLFVRLLDKPKFRLLLYKHYSIILIDEYQDSFRSIMDQFLKYFINGDSGPQFCLFGDAWQTIYTSLGACGAVSSEKLSVIKKEANFRSEEIIVGALNRIRPSLPQISAVDENDGRILVIITNDFYQRYRIPKGYYAGELQEAILHDCISKVREKLRSLGWEENTKTLMLTHKLLAKQQGYFDLLNILDVHFKDKDDVHLLFFMNRVEPVYKALADNNPKALFEALGAQRRPIETISHKRMWKELKEKLVIARNGTIGAVIELLSHSTLLGLPPKVGEWKSLYDKGKLDIPYHKGTIGKFYSIPYAQVIKALGFLKTDAEYSTDHGVKGEEYENVFLVMGRGWNDYKFDETLYLDEENLLENRKKVYIRNRNLFYVCCSRAKKRLAILITVSVNNYFLSYLSNVFGRENIINYNDFMRI